MYKILFTGNTLSTSEIEELRSQGYNIIPAPLDYTENQTIEALKGVDGYILGGDEIATRNVINSSKNLKVIGFFGTGYQKYVDVDAATKKGIPVTYTPGANAYTVAEFTIALLLDAVKRITYLNESMKSSKWEKRQAWNLYGRTIGIVGMGTIGKHVSRILHNGFGMKIVYFSRHEKAEIEKELGARRMDLHDLLYASDIVSLHVGYSDETIGIIGQNAFMKMKESTVLINTSRAELVDPESLYSALMQNQLAIAAFDGYYIEPVPQPANDKYKLLSLPNDRFIVTPHTAYNSSDAVKEMERMVITDVTAVLQGKNPTNLVNPEVRSNKRGFWG